MRSESPEGVPWWGAVSATAAPVLLVAGLMAATRLQPPQYDAIDNTVSALAGEGASDAWVMTFTFVVVACCDIVTAFALRPAARPGRIVLTVAGFGGIMVAAFPDRLGGSLIHACWTGVGFGGLILWPAFAWRRQGSARIPWGLRPATCLAVTATLAALTIWFAVEQGTRGGEMGLAERAAGIAQTVWPLIVVLSCRRFRVEGAALGDIPVPDLPGANSGDALLP